MSDAIAVIVVTTTKGEIHSVPCEGVRHHGIFEMLERGHRNVSMADVVKVRVEFIYGVGEEVEVELDKIMADAQRVMVEIAEEEGF